MNSSTDRGLLFGILAWQNGFIATEPLLTAIRVWLDDKSKPLGEVLVQQGDLTAQQRALLEQLIDARVQQDGGDAGQSLANLSSSLPFADKLAAMHDDVLAASLAKLPPAVHRAWPGSDSESHSSSESRQSDESATSDDWLHPIYDRFEAAWREHVNAAKKSEPSNNAQLPAPRLEDFLCEVPDKQQKIALRELLIIELHWRRKKGETPEHKSYQRRFPDWSHVVDNAFNLANGRYQVPDKSFDKGGVGEVFIARDLELNRNVAFKTVQLEKDRDDTRKRLVIEGEITGGLEHPGIVPVYGLGHFEDGRPFYAMRFIKGENLQKAIQRFHGTLRKNDPHAATILKQDAGAEARDDDATSTPTSTNPTDVKTCLFDDKRLEFRELLGRFVDICQAVAYAHSRKVLHRDLKPGNIMLGKYGETLVVDWGMAKTLGRLEEAVPFDLQFGSDAPLVPSSGSDQQLSIGFQPGRAALGTLQYMSPEQANGKLAELGPATDIFSLGATLYELLTGQAPIGAAPSSDGAPHKPTRSQLEEMAQQAIFPKPRQLLSAVPASLEAICLKAMSRDQCDRYPTAQALAKDIERWLADEPVAVWREPFSIRAQRWMKQHRTTVAVALSVVLLLAIFGPIVAYQSISADEQRLVARLDGLLKADLSGVPTLLRDIDFKRAAIQSRLQALDADESLTATQTLRRDLAWLAIDPKRIDVVCQQLLNLESEELSYVVPLLPTSNDAPRDAAKQQNFLTSTTEPLWKLLGDQDEASEKRFRAACVLARLSPPDEFGTSFRQWTPMSQTLGQLLLAEMERNPNQLGALQKLMAPLRVFVVPSLIHLTNDISSNPKQRTRALSLLSDFASDDPLALAQALMDADGTVYETLLNALDRHAPKSLAVLKSLIDEQSTLEAEEGVFNDLLKVHFADDIEPKGLNRDQRALRFLGEAMSGKRDLRRKQIRIMAKDRLAERQARLCVALLRFGSPSECLPRLSTSSDLRIRAYLVHAFATYRALPVTLIDLLHQNDDAILRKSLIEALGEYPVEAFPDESRTRLIETAAKWLEADPSSGVHSACEWLLRRMGETDRLQTVEQRLLESRKTREPGSVAWYLTSEGHTMVGFDNAAMIAQFPDLKALFPDPNAINVAPGYPRYGDQPDDVPGTTSDRNDIRERNEIVAHPVPPYSIYLASKEVTIRQFREFQRAVISIARPGILGADEEPDRPIGEASWYEAAGYCNWLSEREGIPRDQWCYEPNVFGKYEVGMRIAPDSHRRTGYHLPNGRLWDGTAIVTSPFAAFVGFSGLTSEMLQQYAWFSPASDGRSKPVGVLKPSHFGLFDGLGNAWELCNELNLLPLDQQLEGRKLVFDLEKVADGDLKLVYQPSTIAEAIMRGGGLDSRPEDVVAQTQTTIPRADRRSYVGFRVARTIPARPIAQRRPQQSVRHVSFQIPAPTYPFGGGGATDPLVHDISPGQLDADVYVNEAQTGAFSIFFAATSRGNQTVGWRFQENNFDIFRFSGELRDALRDAMKDSSGRAGRGSGQQIHGMFWPIDELPENRIAQFEVSWGDPYLLESDFSFQIRRRSTVRLHGQKPLISTLSLTDVPVELIYGPIEDEVVDFISSVQQLNLSHSTRLPFFPMNGQTRPSSIVRFDDKVMIWMPSTWEGVLQQTPRLITIAKRFQANSDGLARSVMGMVNRVLGELSQVGIPETNRDELELVRLSANLCEADLLWDADQPFDALLRCSRAAASLAWIRHNSNGGGRGVHRAFNEEFAAVQGEDIDNFFMFAPLFATQHGRAALEFISCDRWAISRIPPSASLTRFFNAPPPRGILSRLTYLLPDATDHFRTAILFAMTTAEATKQPAKMNLIEVFSAGSRCVIHTALAIEHFGAAKILPRMLPQPRVAASAYAPQGT